MWFIDALSYQETLKQWNQNEYKNEHIFFDVLISYLAAIYGCLCHLLSGFLNGITLAFAFRVFGWLERVFIRPLCKEDAS